MKILLIGEFSSLHNNLAQVLKSKGHTVVLANDGDNFKNYYRDIDINGDGSNKIIKNLSRLLKELKLVRNAKNFDVVQYISPSVFSRFSPEKLFFYKLKHQNKSTFLLAAGDDFYYWKAYRDQKFRYSPHENTLIYDLKKDRSPWEYGRLKRLSIFLANYVDKIIPTALSYKIAYSEHLNCSELINFPINSQPNYSFSPSTKASNKKIKILHGVQTSRTAFKGTYLVDKAMERLMAKHSDKIEYIRPVNVPYEQYKNIIKEVDIVIDQVYGYGPAMNALLGMQHGKLILGGYEDELKELNQIDYEPLINIRPNVNDIFNKLENLVENSYLIDIYKKNALRYIREFHSADIIAEKYITIWSAILSKAK